MIHLSIGDAQTLLLLSLFKARFYFLMSFLCVIMCDVMAYMIDDSVCYVMMELDVNCNLLHFEYIPIFIGSVSYVPKI